MSKPLFSDFSEVSSKAWKQKIQADLKGADYNNTLIWHTNEGIDVKPFYHSDEITDNPLQTTSKASTFKICQFIYVAHTEKSNLKATDAISRGAESIAFVLPSEEISIPELLQNIETASTAVRLKPQFLSDEFIKQLPNKKNVSVHIDIIGHLARTGNWYDNLQSDHIRFEAIVKQNKSLYIDTSLYQNAGANCVQQLAYAMAHLNDYLNHFDSKLTSKEKSELDINFEVAVGTNYFFEIAKLRALRIVFRSLASAFNINQDCKIHVTPTKRNKTIYDYNTNMLRTTTECMSAILGGANTISNLAYDAVFHKDNEFGERIARNQLLILKHESYLDKVDNPADGAYYIESLTSQLSDHALELFKDIEQNGGFLSQLKAGTIQKKIKESAQKEQAQFDSGEQVLLGTNRHPNQQDKMKPELELYPFVKTNPIKTLIAPIIEKRLAESLEQERLKSE